PDGVDLLLGLLRLVPDQLEFPIPASCEDRASIPEVEAGGVCLLVIRLGRDSQELGGGIVAGEGAHPCRVLAGHQRVIAEVVACRSGGVASGKDASDRRYAQMPVDKQPAEIVALGGDLRGQWSGTH